ncbi:MAG: hypothetical protein AB8G23_12985 [Myxococcota bacterium]
MISAFRHRTGLISLLALSAYLAAAFLPCEPSPETVSAVAVANGALASHAAAVVSVAAPVSAPMSGHGGGNAMEHGGAHGTHHGAQNGEHHAHGHGHGHHGAGDAPKSTGHPASHGGGGGAEAGSTAAIHASAGAPATNLALKAKCLCGCEQTRGQIGGGAARLGSVVLAAETVGLDPAPVVVPEDRVLSRWVEVHFDDDLVPI